MTRRSLRASSPIWVSEVSLARPRERGGRSLARSRQTRFTRPNRRACSQARRGAASFRYRTRAKRHRSYAWTEALFAGVRPGFHKKKKWVIRLRGYSMNMAKSNLKMYTGPGFLFKLAPLLAWESSRHLATPSQVPAKWRLSNDCSNSVLHGDVHYPDLCDAADWSHCERNLF